MRHFFIKLTELHTKQFANWMAKIAFACDTKFP